MAQEQSRKPLPYANKGDLTTGPVSKHLVRLSIPMIWGIFAVISVQIADMYFISLLGTQKLAAISFTFPVTMTITHLAFGLNIATASVISRMIGAKDMKSARRIVTHSLMFSFLVTATIALVCFLVLDWLFLLLGADDTTLPIIRNYMTIWLFASAFLSIPSNGNSAMRAAGDSTIPAFIMSVVAVVNLTLDPILIFGKFGFPALDVQGAAIATLVAYLCGGVCGLFVLFFKKELICRNGLHLNLFKDSIRRLGFIALPAGITNIIMPVTNAFILSLLAVYGHEAVAAYGVAGRVEAFALITIIALATSMAPVIGQNWGAKLYDRVHQTINLSIGFNFVWSLAVAAILAVFAQDIAGVFSDDPAVIEYARLFFWIVPVTYAFGNLVYGWASSFNAMGKPHRAFAMIVIKALVLMIPAVYIGKALDGVTGIFCAIASVNVIAGIGIHITSWRTCKQEEQAREELEKS